MAWKIEYSKTAKKQLKDLDKKVAKKIMAYLDERVISSEDPKSVAKRLVGPLGGLWRYRVGDFRVICQIEDNVMLVLVLSVGHRKDIYKH
ncbi:MAG: type II toxin-antitoxin system RelE/ParE family toxin [Gammaproteobacteria bacterium]|nr:type II toxin-antitoxin system RelE/ParE family toxin [Gammaproteobacteria bacterium]